MRALVLGGTGMLGKAVATHWRRRQQPVLALGREHADVTDRAQLLEWVEAFQPEIILNCAAFTQVDLCETEVEKAQAVNGDAVAHVVAAAERVDAALIHVSTDYVFAGQAAGSAGDTPADVSSAERKPYREDAPTGPLSVYGQSKLRGEQAALQYPRALVVRTSWLFGPGGPNFVAIMDRLLRGAEASVASDPPGNPVRVVDDQVGCPTYTPYLAGALWDLAALQATGLMHYCNRGAVSWFDFAAEIGRFVAPKAPVVPIPTSEFPRPAPRPAYSVLDTQRFETAVGRRVEPWVSGLAAYLS